MRTRVEVRQTRLRCDSHHSFLFFHSALAIGADTSIHFDALRCTQYHHLLRPCDRHRQLGGNTTEETVPFIANTLQIHFTQITSIASAELWQQQPNIDRFASKDPIAVHCTSYWQALLSHYVH
jgi:hypothetical protein